MGDNGEPKYKWDEFFAENWLQNCCTTSTSGKYGPVQYIGKVVMQVTKLYMIDVSDCTGCQPRNKNYPFENIFSRGDDKARGPNRPLPKSAS